MNAARLFIGGVLAALLLVLAILIWVDRASPIAVVVSALPEHEIRVAINGAVATPGVVTVPPDARLVEVAEAAGGFTPDADMTVLNLAGRVGDGETITIPKRSDGGAAIAPAPTSPRSFGKPIDLNTATTQDLVTLPGIGEVLAGRIVEYRESHGPFTSVDDLSNVDGISDRLVDQIRHLVIVSDDG